jgi:DDE superfamily endonuclease
VKGRKVRLTYAFTSNADGSQKLPAFIIGKAEKPRAFKRKTGACLGFYYRNNAKAWMTDKLYQEWICDWDWELSHQKRKVLWLQDNFSGHIVPDGLQNILVILFKPNLTAHVQPMDQGIIRCFKAHYRTKYIQHTIDRYDCDVSPSQIYDIDQLEAMRLADAAWREVSTLTIRHCWRKAEILPVMPDPPRPTPS